MCCRTEGFSRPRLRALAMRFSDLPVTPRAEAVRSRTAARPLPVGRRPAEIEHSAQALSGIQVRFFFRPRFAAGLAARGRSARFWAVRQ